MNKTYLHFRAAAAAAVVVVVALFQFSYLQLIFLKCVNETKE